jgi:hypothetical protein
MSREVSRIDGWLSDLSGAWDAGQPFQKTAPAHAIGVAIRPCPRYLRKERAMFMSDPTCIPHAFGEFRKPRRQAILNKVAAIEIAYLQGHITLHEKIQETCRLNEEFIIQVIAFRKEFLRRHERIRQMVRCE